MVRTSRASTRGVPSLDSRSDNPDSSAVQTGFKLRLRVQTRPPLCVFAAERRAGTSGVGVLPLASACHTAGVSPRRLGFSPRKVRSGLSGNDTGISQTVSVSPVSIIPPKLHSVSPVSIVPLQHHINSAIYYQRYLTLRTGSFVQKH
jgi:hypothetical protein